MSKVAREVVFLPDFQFLLPIGAPMRFLLTHLYENKPLDAFRFSVEVGFVDSKGVLCKCLLTFTQLFSRYSIIFPSFQKQFTYMPNVRSRIRSINCSKCVRLDWTDIWCKNGTCETADFDRKIGYFIDPSHINVYGSLKLGKYVREKYDKFMNEKRSSLG